MQKKISLALIFRTLSSSFGEYFVHVIGFYLNLAIFATWKSFQHALINYIDIKAKCHNLKKLTCKGTLRQVFICLRPPLHTVYILYTYSHREGVEGWEELNQRED